MFQPSWSIPGIVGEVRELKTKENKVWAYAVKLIAMGGTFETTTKDENLFKKISAGMQAVFAGTFESFGGQLKLALGSFKVADGAPAK
jgi:hypothetical protein